MKNIQPSDQITQPRPVLLFSSWSSFHESFTHASAFGVICLRFATRNDSGSLPLTEEVSLAVMPAAVNPEAGTVLPRQPRGFLIHLGIAAVNALSLLPSCIQCDDSFARTQDIRLFRVSIKPSCWFLSNVYVTSLFFTYCAIFTLKASRVKIISNTTETNPEMKHIQMSLSLLLY